MDRMMREHFHRGPFLGDENSLTRMKPRPPPGIEFQGPRVDNFMGGDDNGFPVITVEFPGANDNGDTMVIHENPFGTLDNARITDPEENHRNRGWMHCAWDRAHRMTFVARWLVVLALLLCLLCLAYVCLAITRRGGRNGQNRFAFYPLTGGVKYFDQQPVKVATVNAEKKLLETRANDHYYMQMPPPPPSDDNTPGVHQPPPAYEEAAAGETKKGEEEGGK